MQAVTKRDTLYALGLGATWPLLINVALVALVAQAEPFVARTLLHGLPDLRHDAFAIAMRALTGLALAAIVATIYGTLLALRTNASVVTAWPAFAAAALSASLTWHILNTGDG